MLQLISTSGYTIPDHENDFDKGILTEVFYIFVWIIIFIHRGKSDICNRDNSNLATACDVSLFKTCNGKEKIQTNRNHSIISSNQLVSKGLAIATVEFTPHVYEFFLFNLVIKFMDLGLFFMFTKSMNVIRRLNRENVYF